MKILAVTSAYPRFHGDAVAPFMESILEPIAALGHTMHIVLPEHRDWRRASVEDGIHFHPYRYSPRRSWTPWGYAQSLERGVKVRRRLYALAPSVFVSGLRACTAVAARERIDLIHAHWVIPNGPIAASAAWRRRIPLVISLHGSDVSVSEKSRWMRALARRSFSRAAAVIAPSEDLLERARHLGARGALELIPHGADPNAIHPDPLAARVVRNRLAVREDELLVLGIGRLVSWKGFDYLLDALARLQVQNVRLVIAGDGDLRAELEKRAATHGLGAKVTFVGTVLRDEVPGYFAAADIVVIPSVHSEGYVDGLPTVALEAMAASKPLVASRVAGLPYVVRHGENGLLVEERDTVALAEAILTLLRDPELRRRMGESGRKRIEESLNWHALAHQYVAVYERAARSHH